MKNLAGKIFGRLKMGWPQVILFAVVAAVYTGLVMLVPAFKDTSVQDIGTYFEWWVIFAIIIVTNCHKNWEAMLKCFVFFLISQPLIYAVEIVGGNLTVDKALVYYKSTWLFMTFLTLPGGFIAYYCKKQNALGAIILGIGNTILLAMGLTYAVKCYGDFPHHFLSFLVCILAVFAMSFGIQKSKNNRTIALLVPVIFLIALVIIAALTGRLHFT